MKEPVPGHLERLLGLVPRIAFNRDLSVAGAEHVDGIDLAALSRRDRPCLNDERRVTGNLVARGGMSDVADMEVTGEEDVSSSSGQPPHCHVGASDQMLLTVSVREIERMVGNDDFDRRRAGCLQPRCGARDLSLVQPAAAVEWERPGAIQPDRNHVLALVRGLQIALNVPPVAAVGIEEPRGNVEQRHVVIARDDKLRRWQSIEEPSGVAKLVTAGALGEVAGHDDQGRRDRFDRSNERLDESRIDAPEMDIREMRDSGHRSGFRHNDTQGAGTDVVMQRRTHPLNFAIERYPAGRSSRMDRQIARRHNLECTGPRGPTGERLGHEQWKVAGAGTR
jgi:hypothetical protein